MHLKPLSRLVPKWTRPLARRMLDAVRRSDNSVSVERSYRRRLITHFGAHGYPTPRTSFVPKRDPQQLDIEAAKRVLVAYHASIQENRDASIHGVADVWDGFAMHFHRELIDHLQQGDLLALATYLCNMSRHKATVGITQGKYEYERLESSAEYREWLGLLILDRLIALAENVGVVRVENPEQGQWGESFNCDIEWVIKGIESQIGVEIVPPQIEGCLFGIWTRAGILSFRDVTAAYAASRMQALTHSSDKVSICEIGAGLGRVAYYCAQLGIKNYDIYDLPLVNVLQGYFLIRAMPDCRITLFGEPGADARGGIKVLPGSVLARAPAKSFDLVLNQDSFPEIDQETVAEYLRQIARSSKAYFLSINHEANTSIPGSTFSHVSVAEMVEKVGGLQRTYRFPCWVRAGYVEELYKVL